MYSAENVNNIWSKREVTSILLWCKNSCAFTRGWEEASLSSSGQKILALLQRKGDTSLLLRSKFFAFYDLKSQLIYSFEILYLESEIFVHVLHILRFSLSIKNSAEFMKMLICTEKYSTESEKMGGKRGMYTYFRIPDTIFQNFGYSISKNYFKFWNRKNTSSSNVYFFGRIHP